MRFLLELVSCCGAPESGGDASPIPELVHQPLEEERALVRRTYRWKRRGRFGGGGGGGRPADEWKPSLCAISEDLVMDKTKSETERIVKRKSGVASHRDKVRVRSYSRDYGQTQSPTVIPAFSPTPFMF